jgi:hypothetical protein
MRLFEQPGGANLVDLVATGWAALSLPPLLFLLRRLPPFAAFDEEVRG